MLNETINNIKNKIQSSSALNDDTRKELLDLLDDLRTEISELGTTQPQESEIIVKSTETSTDEALKGKENKQLSESALERLKKSIEGFETSHPKLTKTINQISTTLAKLGI